MDTALRVLAVIGLWGFGLVLVVLLAGLLGFMVWMSTIGFRKFHLESADLFQFYICGREGKPGYWGYMLPRWIGYSAFLSFFWWCTAVMVLGAFMIATHHFHA